METPYKLREPSPVEDRIASIRRRERAKARAAETMVERGHLPPCPAASLAEKNDCFPGKRADTNGERFPGKQVDHWTGPDGGRVVPVICLLNMKGGVGKTSSCHHLAGTFARRGLRCLVVDNDPQSSLTSGFWGPDAMRSLEPGESVAALYSPDFSPIPEMVIKPTGFDNLWIVPGSEALTRYNITPEENWPQSERGIAEFLAEARDSFDVVMIDCAPNLYLCSWAALVASDYVIIPLQCEDYGAQGLTPVQRSIAAVQAGPNPGLQTLGLLLTMYDRRLAIHGAYEATIRQKYGPLVFAEPFPRAKDFVEAVAARQPISHYKPRSASAKATGAIADEVLRRISEAEVARTGRVA